MHRGRGEVPGQVREPDDDLALVLELVEAHVVMGAIAGQVDQGAAALEEAGDDRADHDLIDVACEVVLVVEVPALLDEGAEDVFQPVIFRGSSIGLWECAILDPGRLDVCAAPGHSLGCCRRLHRSPRFGSRFARFCVPSSSVRSCHC